MSDEIPNRTLVPWCYVKFDGSRAAGIKSDAFRALLCTPSDTPGLFAEDAATEEPAKALVAAFRKHNTETSLLVYQHKEKGEDDAFLSVLEQFIENEKFGLILFPQNADPKRVGAFLDARASVSTQLEGIGLQVAEKGQGKAAAAAQNSPWGVVFEAFSGLDTHSLLGASLAGLIAGSAASDPALPFEGLRLNGFGAPPTDQRPGKVKRGELLEAGVSTFRHDLGGNSYIERVVSTEQKNDGYKSINTTLVLSLLRAEFRNYFSTKYQRFKLASDLAKIAPNQRILTPSIARAEAINLAISWQERGLIQDLPAFKKGLGVNINLTDNSRLDFMLTPNLVKQLVVIAATVRFN